MKGSTVMTGFTEECVGRKLPFFFLAEGTKINEFHEKLEGDYLFIEGTVSHLEIVTFLGFLE